MTQTHERPGRTVPAPWLIASGIVVVALAASVLLVRGPDSYSTKVTQYLPQRLTVCVAPSDGGGEGVCGWLVTDNPAQVVIGADVQATFYHIDGMDAPVIIVEPSR